MYLAAEFYLMDRKRITCTGKPRSQLSAFCMTPRYSIISHNRFLDDWVSLCALCLLAQQCSDCFVPVPPVPPNQGNCCCVELCWKLMACQPWIFHRSQRILGMKAAAFVRSVDWFKMFQSLFFSSISGAEFNYFIYQGRALVSSTRLCEIPLGLLEASQPWSYMGLSKFKMRFPSSPARVNWMRAQCIAVEKMCFLCKRKKKVLELFHISKVNNN